MRRLTMFILSLELTAAAQRLGAQPAGAQPLWRVDPKPHVIVPATNADGDVQFGSASWAARLPSGAIAILDGSDATIRIADTTGLVSRSMGRRGNGPGEFMAPMWIGVCGDTLYAWDMRSARVSVFAHLGYARQFMPVGTNSSFFGTCSRTGAFAAFTMPGPGTPSPAQERGKTSDGRDYEVRRMTAGILVTDATGTERARVPGVLWGEFIAGRLSPNGGFGSLPRPLGGQTYFAFAGERLVVARSDSGQVDIYDERGARTGGFIVTGDRRAPTAQEYERAILPAVSIAPPQMHEALAAFAREVPPPARRPAFARMLTDPSGRIWFVTSMDGDSVTRLRVHAADGSLITTLDVPVALMLFEVGDDHLLGRIESAAGEQAVVAFRIRRGAAGR
jgi:hypothetical protein